MEVLSTGGLRRRQEHGHEMLTGDRTSTTLLASRSNWPGI